MNTVDNFKIAFSHQGHRLELKALGAIYFISFIFLTYTFRRKLYHSYFILIHKFQGCRHLGRLMGAITPIYFEKGPIAPTVFVDSSA